MFFSVCEYFKNLNESKVEINNGQFFHFETKISRLVTKIQKKKHSENLFNKIVVFRLKNESYRVFFGFYELLFCTFKTEKYFHS